MKLAKIVSVVSLVMGLVACGGGGGSPGTVQGAAVAPSAASSSPVSAASIKVDSNVPTLKADGTSVAEITVYALTSGNAALSGVKVDLSATNGVILSASSVETLSTGVKVTMIAPAADQTNRTVTITASCLSCGATSATTTVNVVGATVAIASSGSTSLVVGGATTPLTVTVKSLAGVGISNQVVTFASTNPTAIGLSAATATTDSSGVAKINVVGVGSGKAFINVSALGNAAQSLEFVSGLGASVLSVTSPANNALVITGVSQSIQVSAPPGATKITFATTLGTFGNGLTSQVVNVGGGGATAFLTVSQAGMASVSVIDDLSPRNSASITLVVSPPVSSANKILLNASQTTVPLSVLGGPQNSIKLTARAIYSVGGTDQAVANVPIQFAMTGGPGAGESLSPALVFTDGSGVATATFASGTTASVSNGIVVSAEISGTTVKTGIDPSGNNVLLTVGGQALSVAVGAASVLGESTDKTLYIQAHSVVVTDANNNPVASQLVTLKMRPVAFSIGQLCTPVATYCSEDTNGNGSLDNGEDGFRLLTAEATAGTCPNSLLNPVPDFLATLDRNLTPANSDGGAVPATVTTGSDGTASFNMTYLKGSAYWIINKLTATVSSNGTESSKSMVFRLRGLKSDVEPTCTLPTSPFSF